MKIRSGIIFKTILSQKNVMKNKECQVDLKAISH